MKDEFIIKEELTINASLCATFYLMSKMKILQRIFIFLCVAGVVGALLELSLPSKNKYPLLSALLRIILVPGSMVLFLLVFGILLYLVLYKIKPHLFRGSEYTINHWGVHKKGKGIDLSFQWNKFKYYRETSRFFFLFLDDTNSFLLQKEKFAGETEIKDFKQLLHEKSLPVK